MNDALLSTGKDDWETPHEFFEKLNKEFLGGTDMCEACSNSKNGECALGEEGCQTLMYECFESEPKNADFRD